MDEIILKFNKEISAKNFAQENAQSSSKWYVLLATKKMIVWLWLL